MGVISSDWPTMLRQETDSKIHAADDNEEEKQLAPPRRSAQVQEKKEREAAGTVNAILLTPTPRPTPTPTRGEEATTAKGQQKRRRKGGAAAAATNLQLRSAQAMQPGRHQAALWSGACSSSSHGTAKVARGPVCLLHAFRQQPHLLHETRKNQHADHRPIPHCRRHRNRPGHWRNNRYIGIPHSWQRRRRHRGPDQDRGGAALPRAGPHGAMGHSNDVHDRPHRHGNMRCMLPQTRKELRH
jgi:hypothetical protein